MKISVKTLKGTKFQIEVKPEDTVDDVKKNIEYTHGADTYPAAQQMLIHQGKVLKDGTTLEENKVAENGFVVIMLSKSKESNAEGSTTSSAPTVKAPQTSATPTTIQESTLPQPPAAAATAAPAPAPALTTAPIPAASDVSFGLSVPTPSLVSDNNLEGSIQQILEVGGGNWDRDTVVRALRAAYNNKERAIEYLYSESLPEFDDVFSGIPESAEAPPASGNVSSGQAANLPAQPQAGQPSPVSSAGPNANPLDLFPQGLPNMGLNAGGANTLDFLRTNPQFQALRATVQASPQTFQPMLHELGKENPQLVGLIQENEDDFVRLINEPIRGEEGIDNILGQLAGEMQEALEVTPEESEALERLEAMGFDRELVLEVFFACNKNEELAANYLLDHMHEFED